jgi:hypothetical protein
MTLPAVDAGIALLRVYNHLAHSPSRTIGCKGRDALRRQ